jgi:hypothetical protein
LHIVGSRRGNKLSQATPEIVNMSSEIASGQLARQQKPRPPHGLMNAVQPKPSVEPIG